jgi:hypothetical protein
MAVEKWIAGSGVGFTWTSLMTTELNSIASGNAILGGTAVTNQTALDIFCDFSMVLASAAFVAPNFMGIYLYPLNDDASSYGDSRFGSSAAGPPSSNYSVGSIGIVAATQAQTGTLLRVVMPPGTWKPVLFNQGGVALASSGNTLKYRTYNRAVA